MMGPIIYILCALTCLGAAVLLWRGFGVHDSACFIGAPCALRSWPCPMGF